jgi:hypothetical protein
VGIGELIRRVTGRSIGRTVELDSGLKIFQYSRLSHYKEAQIAANHRKIEKVSVRRENIEFVAQYLRKTLPAPPKFGICHGTRRGLEQQWFSEFLGCSVLGTEISDTAARFPNTIQWDFHDVKPEWVGAVDFIYSNSFDHTYDPKKCLEAWMSCLKPGGLCVMEQHRKMVAPNSTDPLGVTLDRLIELIWEWRGNYRVREIIPTVANPVYLFFLIVEKTLAKS